MQLAYCSLGVDDPTFVLKGSDEGLRYTAEDIFRSSQMNVQGLVRHIRVGGTGPAQYVGAT